MYGYHQSLSLESLRRRSSSNVLPNGLAGRESAVCCGGLAVDCGGGGGSYDLVENGSSCTALFSSVVLSLSLSELDESDVLVVLMSLAFTPGIFE